MECGADAMPVSPTSILHRRRLTFAGAEGFDFAENLKARAERTSISGPSMNPFANLPPQQAPKSVAEPPKPEIRKQHKVPDAFQERILKGDFYMD